MTSIIQSSLFGKTKLYKDIHTAIHRQQSKTGTKPSLVQINRHDYQQLLHASKSKTTLGLSIEGVSVVSYHDIEQGTFHFIA